MAFVLMWTTERLQFSYTATLTRSSGVSSSRPSGAPRAAAGGAVPGSGAK